MTDYKRAVRAAIGLLFLICLLAVAARANASPASWHRSNGTSRKHWPMRCSPLDGARCNSTSTDPIRSSADCCCVSGHRQKGSFDE